MIADWVVEKYIAANISWQNTTDLKIGCQLVIFFRREKLELVQTVSMETTAKSDDAIPQKTWSRKSATYH